MNWNREDTVHIPGVEQGESWQPTGGLLHCGPCSQQGPGTQGQGEGLPGQQEDHDHPQPPTPFVRKKKNLDVQVFRTFNGLSQEFLSTL